MPLIVADAGDGRSVSFRLALEERAWTYVMAVDPKEIARPADAVPYQPAYGGLGPPTLPRYREKPCPLPGLVDETAVSEEVTWRRGSKGAMTSHFAVIQVRPSGREACRTTQEQAGGRSRWDGVLPLKTPLVERPEEADEPTGYWMTNLPATTPIADLMRWAKMRWRIGHGYRELKHGLGLDHFEGRTWRGWHHHVTLVTAAQAFRTSGGSTRKPICRPEPLPGPRHPSGPAEVLDRHLHHLWPPPHHTPKQSQNLTKHY